MVIGPIRKAERGDWEIPYLGGRGDTLGFGGGFVSGFATRGLPDAVLDLRLRRKRVSLESRVVVRLASLHSIQGIKQSAGFGKRATRTFATSGTVIESGIAFPSASVGVTGSVVSSSKHFPRHGRVAATLPSGSFSRFIVGMHPKLHPVGVRSGPFVVYGSINPELASSLIASNPSSSGVISVPAAA